MNPLLSGHPRRCHTPFVPAFPLPLLSHTFAFQISISLRGRNEVRDQSPTGERDPGAAKWRLTLWFPCGKVT